MKRLFFILLSVTALLAGCATNNLPPDLPKLVPCTIRLTQEGTPLEGALVTLHDTAVERSFTYGGRTDSTGTLHVETSGRYRGVPVGTYKVAVRKYEEDPSKLPPAPDEEDQGFAAWQEKAQEEVQHSYLLIEKPYTKADTTSLELDVPDVKGVEQTFDVGRKVRVRI